MKAAVRELLERALELARSGVRIYEGALGCAVRDQLEEQWQDDLAQMRLHETALRTAARALGLEAETETPARSLVRQQALALVSTLEQAPDVLAAEQAERLAAETVLEWESRVRLAWELICESNAQLKAADGQVWSSLCQQAPDQQDERLHRARAWTRALWAAAQGRQIAIPSRRKKPRRPSKAASDRAQAV